VVWDLRDYADRLCKPTVSPPNFMVRDEIFHSFRAAMDIFKDKQQLDNLYEGGKFGKMRTPDPENEILRSKQTSATTAHRPIDLASTFRETENVRNVSTLRNVK
jgi:hypothetical protein